MKIKQVKNKVLIYYEIIFSSSLFHEDESCKADIWYIYMCLGDYVNHQEVRSLKKYVDESQNLPWIISNESKTLIYKLYRFFIPRLCKPSQVKTKIYLTNSQYHDITSPRILAYSSLIIPEWLLLVIVLCYTYVQLTFRLMDKTDVLRVTG